MHRTTILVVEDDPVQRRQLARILTAFGHEVVQASTGREAIQVLKEQEVDLILTDLRMPEMGGVALIEHVKKEHAGVPVAALTSYPEEMDEFEADALLIKPFGEERLMELVRRFLPQNGTQGNGQHQKPSSSDPREGK